MSATKRTRKRKTGRPAKTLEQHAAEQGVSTDTIRRRVRGGGAQVTREDKLRQEVRKLTAEATKQERMLEILDNEYVPRSTVLREAATIARVCNALLRAVESELPPLVAGQSPAQAEKTLKGWTPTWAKRLSDAQDNVWIEAKRETIKELRGDLKKAARAQGES